MKELVRSEASSSVVFGLPVAFAYFAFALPAVRRNTEKPLFCFYLCIYAVVSFMQSFLDQALMHSPVMGAEHCMEELGA